MAADSRTSRLAALAAIDAQLVALAIERASILAELGDAAPAPLAAPADQWPPPRSQIDFSDGTWCSVSEAVYDYKLTEKTVRRALPKIAMRGDPPRGHWRVSRPKLLSVLLPGRSARLKTASLVQSPSRPTPPMLPPPQELET
jgi:hypothetical protein